MKELFDATFSYINIIPTILLMFTLLYGIVVIIGLADMKSIDIDVDADLDVDVDADIHVDADVDADTDIHTHVDAGGHGHISWLGEVLTFFNVGQVPFMIVLSFVALPMWVISLLTNYYLGISSFLLATLLLIPNFIVSLFIAKFLTAPFAKFFAQMDGDKTTAETLLGQIGSVVITVKPDKIGQVELSYEGAKHRIYATCNKGVINENEKVLIIDYIKDKKYYLCAPYESID